MKTEDEIRNMVKVFSKLEDHNLMKEDYCLGVQNALSFVLLDEREYPDIDLHRLLKMVEGNKNE